MSWFAEEFGITLIAKVLQKAMEPVAVAEIRDVLKIAPVKFERLLCALIEIDLLKLYVDFPLIANPLVAITEKGNQFLKRYNSLLQIIENCE